MFSLTLDRDNDGIEDSSLVASVPYYYNHFRPRHHSGFLSGSVDTRATNFMFPDMHVDFRTFRMWLNNDRDLSGALP